MEIGRIKHNVQNSVSNSDILPLLNRSRREPITLAILAGAVLIVALALNTAGGGIAAFALFKNQNSKINEVVKLSTIDEDFYVYDQKQWQNLNKINIESLKNRENLIHKIKYTFCNASATHKDNKKIKKKSILKFQYQYTFVNVVKALTSKRINSEIIPISLLRDKLLINNSIF